jgi:iron complex transport system permease protein
MRRWLVVRPPGLPISFRVRANAPLTCLALVALIFVALTIHIAVGEFLVPPLAVVNTLLGNGSRQYNFIVLNLRLPRALVAILVGMALAVSGAILQGLTRNPLASPDIIGISQGASLAAVSMIIVFSNAPATLIPPVALMGASLAALLVYWLAWHGGSSPTRLLLVGIGLSAVSASLIQIMLAITQTIRISQAIVWLAGSVYGRSWDHLQALLPWMVISLPLALLLAWHLDALHLGDDLARGLGAHVERQRALLLVTCVALAGTAVATAGTIGFVGLMAPHAARKLVGPAHSALLPTAALTGAFLVLVADLLGRVVVAPIEVPAGVITAIVGAPYFVWLLLHNHNT